MNIDKLCASNTNIDYMIKCRNSAKMENFISIKPFFILITPFVSSNSAINCLQPVQCAVAVGGSLDH